jgi:hypothetical protein
MYNADTEILFPSRLIPSLKNLRGNEWSQLVEMVEKTDENDPAHLAFVLMMVKLGGCASCNADSFKAMKGCTQCAKITIKRYRGNDAEILRQYKDAKDEISTQLAKKE